MSDIYEKLKSEINKGVTLVNSKSKSLIEITKLNSQISSINAQKKGLLDELGEFTYNLYTDKSLDVDSIASKCRTIDGLEHEILEKQASIQKIQEEEKALLAALEYTKCLCGATLKEHAKFCGKCGMKLEDIVKKTQEDASNEEEISVKICECGCELDEDLLFCCNCGKEIYADCKDSFEDMPEVLFCECRNEMKAGTKFCNICGCKVYEPDEIDEMLNCQIKICCCGNELKENAKFCNKCGCKA